MSFGFQGWRLRYPPGFTAVVTVTLALGIGANSALFSVLDGVLFRPLPFREPDRLVMAWESHAEKGLPEATASYPNLRDWQRQSRTLEGLGGYQFLPFDLTGVEQPERVWGARVTGGLLPLLGVAPSVGRLPLARESEPGAEPVAVVSDSLFRRLGGRADLLGRPLRLNGRSYTLVGVMPPGFHFPPTLRVREQTLAVPVELWTPVIPGAAEEDRGARLFFPVGRLAPGVSLGRAQSEMSTVAARLARAHPADDAGWGVRLVPLREQMVRHVRPAFRMLLATAAAVLLLACGNVAFLLLVRGAERRQELAIRVALGAGRRRLAGQLLGETLVLGLPGLLLGLLLARAGLALVARLAPQDVPRLAEAALDGRALAFTLVLALLVTLAVGLVPALWAARAAAGPWLRAADGTGPLSGTLASRRLLVGAEVALALALVTSVGLLARSFLSLTGVDLGFAPRDLVVLELQLPPDRYADSPRVLAFQRDAVQRVAALPGVERVGVINFPPLSGYKLQAALTLEDRPAPLPAERPMAEYRVLTPETPEALGLSLVAGRTFRGGDDEAGARVALVNRSLARSHWPDASPLGRTLALSPLAAVTRGRPMPEPVSFRIVGIVADSVHASPEAAPPAMVYVPYAQDPWPFFSLLVRTARPVESVAADVRGQIAGLDRGLAVGNVRALSEDLSESLARPRFLLALLAAFSLLAVVLAGVGVFGLGATLMSQRNREVAIRLALGARGRDLFALILREAWLPVAAGLGLGVAMALGLARWIAGLLFQVPPTDPATYAAAAALMAGLAALAAGLPVLRALRKAPAGHLKS